MELRRSLFLVALASITTMVGCGGGGGVQTGSDEWVLGQWTAHSLSASLNGPREALRDYGITARFRANADRTYQAYKFEPNEGERCSVGTWEYRGDDSWLFTNTTYGGTSMLFRRGSELYETASVNGQQVWMWFRRTTEDVPTCAPVGPAITAAYLFQQAPGDEPVIRVRVSDTSLPADRELLGWLFFRATAPQALELLPSELVGAVLEARLPGRIWDDGGQSAAPVEIADNLSYRAPAGTTGQVAVNIAFAPGSLEGGRTYLHRAQWILEPLIGIAQTLSGVGQGDSLEQTLSLQPRIHVEPPEALSSGSEPTAGVTFFVPPALQLPAGGAQNQSTSSIDFSWNGVMGADSYVLQVFPEDDPDGRRSPRYSVAVNRETSGTISRTIQDTFASSSRFYWRVGACRSGEDAPENGRLNSRGWLFSEIRTFTTAATPTTPTPPSF